MPEVDYLIADGRVCPPEHDGCYTERVVRLDGSFWCFQPPDGAPDPTPTPMLRNGYVTFGSFNAAQKISDSTVRLWAAVLNIRQQIPCFENGISLGYNPDNPTHILIRPREYKTILLL